MIQNWLDRTVSLPYAVFLIKIGFFSFLGLYLGVFYIGAWLEQFGNGISLFFIYSSSTLLTLGGIYLWSSVLVNLETDLGEEYKRQVEGRY